MCGLLAPKGRRRHVRSVSPCTRRMIPLADCPRDTLAAIEGVLTDIDETVSTHGRLTAEAYGAHGGAEKGRIPRHPGDRPAGRLVRPHRPLLAGRRRGGRERRLLDVARPPGGQAQDALRAERGRARRRQAPAGSGARRRCCATCRARASPRTSPIARPTSPSTSARTCRRCRMPRSCAS